LQRLGGTEWPCRQDQFLGTAFSQRSRQGLRTASTGNDTEAGFGQRKTRCFGGIDKIDTGCEFTATTVGGTIDRRNKRNRTIDHRTDHAFINQVLGCPLGIAHAIAFLEIATRTKSPLAGTGEDGATIIRLIECQLLEAVHQVGRHLGIKGIGGVGAIQRDLQ